MKKHILTLATCGLILTYGPAGASAEEGMGDRGHCQGMMGHGGIMGGGMSGARTRHAIHLCPDG
jgi:hypothetical protein